MPANCIRENATVGQTPYANEYEALEFDAARRVTAVVKGSRRSEFFYDAWSRRVRTVERDATTVVSDKRYVCYPREMGATEGEAFLTHLATERNVSAAPRNQAKAGRSCFSTGKRFKLTCRGLGRRRRTSASARRSR